MRFKVYRYNFFRLPPQGFEMRNQRFVQIVVWIVVAALVLGIGASVASLFL